MNTKFRSIGINKTQFSIIEGSLLGDGCLSRLKAHPTWNWKFTKTQSQLDNDGCDKLSYLKYHNEQLASFIGGNIFFSTQRDRRIANNLSTTPRTQRYQYVSRTHPLLTSLSKEWYIIGSGNNLIKKLPSCLELSPLSLCIWFMDDGSKEINKNRYKIVTNCFNENEVCQLIETMKKKYNIKSTFNKNGNSFVINISDYSNCCKFYEVIKPCVSWDCFKHKIQPPKSVILLKEGKHPCAKLTDNDLNMIAELYSAGESQTFIAEKLNVKQNTISDILGKKSWKSKSLPQSAGNKGERNSNAKLTVQQVEEIRLLKEAMSYSAIAKKYNVTKSLISHIFNNRCWIKNIL